MPLAHIAKRSSYPKRKCTSMKRRPTATGLLSQRDSRKFRELVLVLPLEMQRPTETPSVVE
jgi:hypothetical protein